MTNTKATLLALVLGLPGAALAAGGASAGPGTTLRISGTGAGLGAIRLVADAFSRVQGDVRIEILPSLGSGGAIQAVEVGALDVGIAARPLEPKELARGLAQRSFGRTPLVLAVGPGTEASGITPGELARMYRGELLSWPNGERVRVVLRPRADTDTSALRAASPELAAAIDVALERPGMLMARTNQECATMLARTPGSIGPTTLAQLRTEATSLGKLAWNGVQPTLENLESGAYPLAHVLSVVVRARPSPEVLRFLAFLRSPDAAAILRGAGTLPLPFPPLE